MHTVELLDQATEVAKQLGIRFREDWLGGSGGTCELKGQKWVFLDLAEDPAERLDHVLQALQGDPRLTSIRLPPALAELLPVRRSA